MVGAITGDMLTAIMGDMGMVGGVILTGGATPTGGLTLITIPIIMGVMGNRQCLRKGLPLRQHLGNSNLLIGTSARTQRVTTRMLKIAQVVG